MESGEDKRKFVGFLSVALFGLLLSVTLLVLNFTGLHHEDTLPGTITLFALSALACFSLLSGNYKWAVNTVFLFPFLVYFFFISAELGAYPVIETVGCSLFVLLSGFFLLLLFDGAILKLTIYYVFAIGTLLYHLWLAGKLEAAITLHWPNSEFISNPLVVFTVVYTAALAVVWNYRLIIRELKITTQRHIEQYNKAFKSIGQAVISLRVIRDEFDTPFNLEIEKVNGTFESVFKMSARDLLGKDAELLFSRLFRGAFDWYEIFLKSKKTHFEFYAEHIDRWFEVYILRVSDDQMITMFYDVSTRQKSIEQLKESRHRFKVLLEAIPDMFFIIDKDGIYVDFVLKENENLVIKPDEIIGNSIFEVGFSEKMSRKIYQCIQDAIRFDSIETIEYVLEVEKGTAMFEMRIARLNDESVITIARDITKRKLAEVKLEEAKNKAEEADRLKSAFLANISHEIRTPMNAIIGFSRMIGSSDFSVDEKNKFIDIVISNGKLLMALINDMISLSKIESDQIEVHKTNCLVNDMLMQMYKEFSFELDTRDIKLKLNNESPNPKFSVYTDQTLLKEVIEKLLDNALKFTDEGTVEFGYRIVTGAIEFFVKDTGIGISEADIERIFDRFHQLDNRTTRNYGGTGLGLSIAQMYVKKLGGKLNVTSIPGEGSTFYFSLPMDQPEGHLKIIR